MSPRRPRPRTEPSRRAAGGRRGWASGSRVDVGKGGIYGNAVRVRVRAVRRGAAPAAALDLAGRVRGAVEAGGSAAGAPRASVERAVAEIHGVLAGRAAGAHLSITSSAAATVEAAFRVAGSASERSLSADL